MAQHTPYALHRFAVVTAAATWLLIIAGSLVTSTGSGLSVPDWPLSFGTWWPPMEGGIFYEHGHRMIAGVVGLLIIALAIATARARAARWLVRLGWIAAGAVVVQALLGGMTVLLQLPPHVSIAHACLAQLVFCVVVALAYGSAPAWSEVQGRVDARVVRLGWMVGGLAAAQILLGAIIRHTGYAVFAHLLVGCGLAVHVVLLSRRLMGPGVPGVLQRHAKRLAALVGVQLVLGLVLWTHRGVLVLRTLHVACGALVLAQTMLTIWDATRHAARRPA